jgi:ATP-dependent Clp protease ATP-binding subunit ClpA
VPLSEPSRAAQVRGDLQREQHAIIREAPLPMPPFQTRAGVADFLLRCLGENRGCLLLIEESVKYRGGDAMLRDCFGHPVHNGWRPLRVLRSDDAATALEQADEFLGLGAKRARAEEPREFEAPAPPGAHEHADDRFGADLVEEARRGRLPRALFRELETGALVRTLLKAGKNSACLVGDAGVGKTAIVENLAIAIATGDVVPGLLDCRILDVNLSFLAAGAVHANEFEGRLARILDRARKDRRIILFFDELHTICAAGGNAAQLVKSDLGRGRIRCIGATTPGEFRTIEEDAALARRFQKIRVEELSREQSIEVLHDCRPRLQSHHGVLISDELIARSVDLALRFAPDRRLPDKALDLLDEACASARVDAWREREISEGSLL